MKKFRKLSGVFDASYTGRGAGWLNALAATLDLDGVELGLGGDGHGGGDGDAEIEKLDQKYKKQIYHLKLRKKSSKSLKILTLRT